MTDSTTAPTQDVIEEQALVNATAIGQNGTPTTITPWTRILLMENIGSSIHGKSQRPPQ